jgi:hypothetical protein
MVFAQSLAVGASCSRSCPDEAYYSRPIDARHPIVVLRRAPARLQLQHAGEARTRGPSIDARLESLFARGIDPSDAESSRRNGDAWPARAEVLQFAAESRSSCARGTAIGRSRIAPAIRSCTVPKPCSRSSSMKPCIRRRCSICGNRLPFEQKHRPDGYRFVVGRVPVQEWIEVPGGSATLGADDSRDSLRLGQTSGPRMAERVDAFLDAAS